MREISAYINDVVDNYRYKNILGMIDNGYENYVVVQSCLEHALNREHVHPLTDNGWTEDEFINILKNVLMNEESRISLIGDIKGPYGGDKGACYILCGNSIYCIATEYVAIGSAEYFIITSFYRCNVDRVFGKVKLIGKINTVDNYWRKTQMKLSIDYVSDDSISDKVFIHEDDIRIGEFEPSLID